jgi:hypothetical protein
MKYQKSIQFKLDLKQIPISELLKEREDVNDAFDNAIEYLRDHNIEFPNASHNSLFFDKLNVKGASTSYKFEKTKERMLGSCFHLNTPDEIFEIIIVSAFLSCQFKNTLAELIIGNPINFQVEITFDEGKIRSYRSYKVIDNEFHYFNDQTLLKKEKNFFQCTEAEMLNYFDSGVLKRLVRKSN